MELFINNIFLLFASVLCNFTEYLIKRGKLIEAENKLAIGGNSTLNAKEIIVNKCLMQRKFQELDYAFDNPQYFNFSHHYFQYKDKMRASKVYKIIQEIPKGAALHVHDLALLGPDYVMNITYMDHLYICHGPDDILKLKFANQLPKEDCDGWQLISDARRGSKNVSAFDADLRTRFTLVVADPETVYPSSTETWVAFQQYFSNMLQLLAYRPIREQYFYDALKTFREDKVMYIELRIQFIELYELNGTTHDEIENIKIFRKILNRFKIAYPDFEGAKIIFSPSRFMDTNEMATYLQTARDLKTQTPEIFAGLDLVGQEDTGRPLIEFAPQLLEAKDLNYFFHAGETGWYGTRTDSNLYDAILLGTKRIGHAYALIKHPLLMEAVVERDIGLEINVISNQVLSLVRDVRNHPLSAYIARGMGVVLSSDDPGAWEAAPLSDDFYAAFVGASSRLADLALLKTLAKNSLKYSSLGPREKAAAIKKFHAHWKRFIDNFDCSNY